MTELQDSAESDKPNTPTPFTFADAEQFIKSVNEDPTLLFREPDQSKKNLHQLLQATFETCK